MIVTGLLVTTSLGLYSSEITNNQFSSNTRSYSPYYEYSHNAKLLSNSTSKSINELLENVICRKESLPLEDIVDDVYIEPKYKNIYNVTLNTQFTGKIKPTISFDED